MDSYLALQSNRCLICSCPGRSLCPRCAKLYIFDVENGWVRKKLRLQRGSGDKLKYHKTERKLLEILKQIFGRDNVISSVHPLWAFSMKKVLLEYDIGVKSKNLLVEYNGIQHYEYPNFFHKTRQDFTAQVERDERKKELAKANGWNLLVVPYTEDVTYGNIFRTLQREGITCLMETIKY